MKKPSFIVLVDLLVYKQLNHYIIPSLVDDKPNAIIIHVGTNDILDKLNHKDIARNIISITINCRKYGVHDIAISSVLIKKTQI